MDADLAFDEDAAIERLLRFLAVEGLSHQEKAIAQEVVRTLTEAGVPSRAWPDWFYPATRLWIDAYNMSAVYTPDGMLIQFDNGTIWQRDLPAPPPPVRRRR